MASLPKRVLIAFDKFKDSLTAERACAVAAQALSEKHPDWTIDSCPFTDGGDGFEGLLTHAVGGRLQAITVDGPLLTPVVANLGLTTAGAIPPTARALLGWTGLADHAIIAIVGMASGSGLALLRPDERNPWKTTSTGTGQLIEAAAKSGAAGIVLGLGGSATNDLGLGALAALGFRFMTAGGETLDPPIPLAWSQLARITRGRSAIPAIRIACDVDNPLLGPHGAAAVYGPQKGLLPADLPELERQSARIADLLCAACGEPATRRDEPGSGAAGGAGFGLRVGAGALLVPGTELVSAWVDLDRRIAGADLVITGEGRFDASSLSGKGPAVLARRAQALGKEVHLFAGAISAAAPAAGVALHPISPPGLPLAQALADAPGNLARTVAAAL